MIQPLGCKVSAAATRVQMLTWGANNSPSSYISPPPFSKLFQTATTHKQETNTWILVVSPWEREVSPRQIFTQHISTSLNKQVFLYLEVLVFTTETRSLPHRVTVQASLLLSSFCKANPYLSQSLDFSQGDGACTAAALWVLGLYWAAFNPPTSLGKTGCLQDSRAGKTNSLAGSHVRPCFSDHKKTQRKKKKQRGILPFQKSTYLPYALKREATKHSILQAEQKRYPLCSKIACKFSFHNFLLLSTWRSTRATGFKVLP